MLGVPNWVWLSWHGVWGARAGVPEPVGHLRLRLSKALNLSLPSLSLTLNKCAILFPRKLAQYYSLLTEEPLRNQRCSRNPR